MFCFKFLCAVWPIGGLRVSCGGGLLRKFDCCFFLLSLGLILEIELR